MGASIAPVAINMRIKDNTHADVKGNLKTAFQVDIHRSVPSPFGRSLAPLRHATAPGRSPGLTIVWFI